LYQNEANINIPASFGVSIILGFYLSVVGPGFFATKNCIAPMPKNGEWLTE